MHRLWHRLSEDVSGRSDWIHPLPHQSDAQVHPRLRWSVCVGEEPQWAQPIRILCSTSGCFQEIPRRWRMCVFWGFLCCSGRQSYSCSEKLLMLMQLWLIRRVRNKLFFCLLLLNDELNHVPVSFIPSLFRHLKDAALNATCWASSCRPSRKDSAFPRSSWIRVTAWQHTGNWERGRCVLQSVSVGRRFVWQRLPIVKQEVGILCEYLRGHFFIFQ